MKGAIIYKKKLHYKYSIKNIALRIMLNALDVFGKYCIFLFSTLKNREKFRVYLERTLLEIDEIGLKSLDLVVLVSVFMGIVTSIQTAANLSSEFVPKAIVGMATRNMTVLELSPTVLGIIVTGKVGSNIASQLSSMRISEQIDALEMFGINAKSFLVLPKIIASLICYPLLVMMSIFLSITAGYYAAIYLANISPADYIEGVQWMYRSSDVYLAIWKSLTFSFLMSSISSFIGFYTYGGSLEVGRASTKAFTVSCMAILVADYLVAQLLLKF